jgi:hypothetical protein
MHQKQYSKEHLRYREAVLLVLEPGGRRAGKVSTQRAEMYFTPNNP